MGQVVVPLRVFSMAMLMFMFCWNDFLFSFSLRSTTAARTVPATLAIFTGASQFQHPYGTIAAVAVAVTLPVVILVLLYQRRIVSGLTSDR